LVPINDTEKTRKTKKGISRKGSFERKLKVLVSFLSDEKQLEGNCTPSHAHFYQSHRSKFLDSHLFSIVEKSNNYVFEDELIPMVPGGRAARYEL